MIGIIVFCSIGAVVLFVGCLRDDQRFSDGGCGGGGE